MTLFKAAGNECLTSLVAEHAGWLLACSCVSRPASPLRWFVRPRPAVPRGDISSQSNQLQTRNFRSLVSLGSLENSGSLDSLWEIGIPLPTGPAALLLQPSSQAWRRRVTENNETSTRTSHNNNIGFKGLAVRPQTGHQIGQREGPLVQVNDEVSR